MNDRSGLEAAIPAVTWLPAGRLSWSWLGVVPFFAFAFFFLILPSGYLIVGAFLDADGNFTLANIVELSRPIIVSAYWNSIKLSGVSGGLGAVFGFLLAYALTLGGLPRWLRPTLMTFFGVASNFAGVPLAFSFLATLGRTGLVTVLAIKYFDFNIYKAGFNLLSFSGLVLTYLYFQIPLMVLIITPAVEGLRREWHEASQILGASFLQYWRHVALPILWPSVLGAALLLFANSFGAVATAFALTGPQLNIATILLFAQIRGDALHNPNLGYALALGMIVITGVSNGAYIWLRGRSERWLR
jgi:putative spermidine/putrescine transport system permease protein